MNPVVEFDDTRLDHVESPFLEPSEFFEDGKSVYPFGPDALREDYFLHGPDKDAPVRVFMFQPRFAPLVQSGAKLQTVRPRRKFMPKIGDKLSLRAWTGQPYRSKQRLLRESHVHAVATFHLTFFEMMIDGVRSNQFQQDIFARCDGFKGADEMREWFGRVHGLPFDGFVTYWTYFSPRF